MLKRATYAITVPRTVFAFSARIVRALASLLSPEARGRGSIGSEEHAKTSAGPLLSSRPPGHPTRGSPARSRRRREKREAFESLRATKRGVVLPPEFGRRRRHGVRARAGSARGGRERGRARDRPRARDRGGGSGGSQRASVRDRADATVRAPPARIRRDAKKRAPDSLARSGLPRPREDADFPSLHRRNIVATVNLDCKLDLKTIAFHARNVEYNPKVRKP